LGSPLMYSAADLILRILIDVVTHSIPNVQETIAQVRCAGDSHQIACTELRISVQAKRLFERRYHQT
jgi:hypothetical protein